MDGPSDVGRQRVAAARQQNSGPGCPGWEEFELGRLAMIDADYLVHDPQKGNPGALLLGRSAARLLARAQLVRADSDPGLAATPEECWARFAAHPIGASLLARATEEERSSIDSVLGSGALGRLAQLAPPERALAVRTLAELTREISAPMEDEARRVSEARRVRRMRLAGGALALGLFIWLIITGIARLTAPPNLALHKPVTVPTPLAGAKIDPDGLVDGKFRDLGFHSGLGKPQQVTIDLGQVHRISQVVVHNRTDCCQERAVPLSIEVSTDGQNFRSVAQRLEPFDRWRAKFAPTSARHVRLTSTSGSYFHLLEVEVY